MHNEEMTNQYECNNRKKDNKNIYNKKEVPQFWATFFTDNAMYQF
jgi:hypothetical protein